MGEDGTIEVREGAYDGMYHFLDGMTGLPLRPPLATRDLAKGSATTDPDGFPLYYAGSRDGRFRIVATDRHASRLVLWSIDGATSVERPLRNDDWDGAALVVDDVLFEGGENGWLYVIRLHRRYDELGLVTVEPEDRGDRPGVRRRAAPGRSATTRSRSRTRSPSMTGSCTSPTPAASCRDGTSPTCWPAAPPGARLPVLDRATTPTPRS